MSTLTFLVEVETERESGLIASNDEQSDKIQDAITEAVDGLGIDSIGARSDSTYNVTSVDIEELEKKGRASVRAEYEAAVRAEEPTDAELRQELKSARLELEGAKRHIEDLERAATKRREEADSKATGIYQILERGREEERVYMLDGVYDRVCFQMGAKEYERIEIGLTREYVREGRGAVNGVEIRNNNGGLVVIPESGNVVKVRPWELGR